MSMGSPILQSRDPVLWVMRPGSLPAGKGSGGGVAEAANQDFCEQQHGRGAVPPAGVRSDPTAPGRRPGGCGGR